jgi:endonuclease YncB( thermonuclease family)
VKFTARDMVLYDRREAAIDAEAVGQFVVRPESFDIQSALRPVQRQQLARVLPGMGKDGGVVDGDTFKVELVDDGTVEEIRLSTADAPETPKRDGYNGKTNETFRAFWSWPETAGRQGGEPGEAPTTEQLDQWGSYATKYVNERWLPEERLVWLVRDSGSAATGEYGRKLFQVYNLRGESLDEHLIQQGLAFPKNYPTEGRVNGQLQGRQERLFRLFKEERANAGRPGASGVWKSFSPPSNL